MYIELRACRRTDFTWLTLSKVKSSVNISTSKLNIFIFNYQSIILLLAQGVLRLVENAERRGIPPFFIVFIILQLRINKIGECFETVLMRTKFFLEQLVRPCDTQQLLLP